MNDLKEYEHGSYLVNLIKLESDITFSNIRSLDSNDRTRSWQ